jgi:hypothetical protein
MFHNSNHPSFHATLCGSKFDVRYSKTVGLLNAPKNTKLYRRLETENRLTTDATGNNTDFTINFIPKMKYPELLDGYQKIIQNIYTTKPYYSRIRHFLRNYKPILVGPRKIGFSYLLGFIKSIFIIGIFYNGRREYWKLFIWTLLRRPGLFMNAMTYAVYGYHYQRVYRL